MLNTPATRTLYQASSSRSVKLNAAMKIPSKYSQISPKGDLALVKVAAAEEMTATGIALPTTAIARPTSGKVLKLGDGQRGAAKTTFTLKEGDTVIYSKFGFTYTEVLLQDEDYILIREDDVIGVVPSDVASADDVPELQPMADRVLVKVRDASNVSSGGVLVPDAAKDKPVVGTVVRTGPGKKNKDGSRTACKAKEGDKIVYFKYAGDQMETREGEQYVVLRDSDILCKA